MDIIADGPTLVLRGDFDARSTWEVRAALQRQMEGFERDVVIDVAGVTSVDMTAIKLLAAASIAAGQHGHHLTLRGCRPGVRRLMHLSRLARFVEVERAAATA